MTKMLVLLNHTLTEQQIADAERSLGISAVELPPADIAAIWSSIDPVGELPMAMIGDVCVWLSSVGEIGDYVLVQGDFGATYYIVSWCFLNGFIPVYSTTKRVSEETILEDGSKYLKHIVKHINFRVYRKV